MKKLFVLFVALTMIGFAVPVMAADWSFYGSARMSTFWTDTSGGDLRGDDEALGWSQQGNSRIGARVKGETIGGRFEYGTGVNMRLLYGTWNFGSGRILLGQTYTPVNLFYSNQVFGGDSDLLDVGGLYGGRHGEISVKVAGFEFALVDPQAPTDITATGDGDGDTSTPKIEAAYGFSTDVFNVKVVGGYQTYEVENSTDAGTYDVDAWVVGGGGGANFGPAYVKGNIWVAQNYSNYGLPTWNLPTGPGGASIVAGDIEDSDSWGFLAVVGFKASDMLSFEGGYGYVSHELDVSGSTEDKTQAFYAQASITIAPGFFIVPEVGFYDFDVNGADVDAGDMTYFGAKWQMNF